MNIKKRLFLLEQGDIVVVRDENRNTAAFGDLNEFYRCAPIGEFGIDLSGEWYIDYELNRNIHLTRAEDGDTVPVSPVSPVPAYENIIDNVQTLIDRKDDPYFGGTLSNAKTRKRAELRQEAKDVIENKYDWVEMVPYIADLTKDRTQLKADVDAVIAAYVTARNAVNSSATVAEVKAVTAVWPTL